MTGHYGRGTARARARAVSAATGAALCLLAALPARSASAADPSAPGAQARAVSDTGRPSPYAFQPDAPRVTGAATTGEAPALAAGGTYRDSIRPGGKRVYRVDLDAKTNAYVSAVAVPRLGTKVAFGDKIEVSLQNGDGQDCSSNESEFGVSTDFPRPLAAYAYRTAGGNASTCAAAGPYYVVVERTSDPGSSQDPWDLELRHVSEPGLSGAGPTRAPENWPSASPAPLTADPRPRSGGTGFYDAAPLTKGSWTSGIRPGETVFYRVPVDWGQQLFAGVDLASAPDQGADGPTGTTGTAGGSGGRGTPGFVSGALAVSLFNPARGFVESANSPLYDGQQKSTSLDPLPPVAYQNRYSYRSGERDARFAGWYYLRVSLNPKVGAAFGDQRYGVTVRIDVTGTPTGGPRYAGPAGDFAVTGGDRDEASSGRAAAAGADGGTMRLVGVSGIGAGTVLVLGLGAWTLLARRRPGTTRGSR